MWYLATAALAADWPMLQGTEPGPDPAPLRPYGFVQALGEGIVFAEPARGLSDALAADRGQLPSFDRVGSGNATWGFSIRRARLGLRGAVPATDGRVAWLLAAEFGDNSLTRVDPVVLTDASVTLSYVPGARVRVGQFKLPLGEEALEMNPAAAEFVNPSAATGQLLAENTVVAGAYTSGSSGFRDVGVQVFDSFALGRAELSYALMLSDGRMGTLDDDDGKDLTGRVAFSPIVWGDRTALHRDELHLFAWWQQGPRTIDGATTTRIRRGAGVELERSGWHARAEIVSARGAIEAGASPPFPGSPIVVYPDGRALGGYVFAHWQPGRLGGGVRWDALRRDPEDPAALRLFQSWTADLQLRLDAHARILVDWEHRSLSAPEGSPDAVAIARTMGDRASVQVGVTF